MRQACHYKGREKYAVDPKGDIKKPLEFSLKIKPSLCFSKALAV